MQDRGGCETGVREYGRVRVWGVMLECVRSPPGGGGECGLGLFFAKFAGGDPSFDGFDFFESSSVSFLGGVSSAEEGFDDFEGQFGSDDTGTDAQNVHIIVFDPLSGRVGIVAQARTDSWEFVSSDAYPDS